MTTLILQQQLLWSWLWGRQASNSTTVLKCCQTVSSFKKEEVDFAHIRMLPHLQHICKWDQSKEQLHCKCFYGHLFSRIGTTLMHLQHKHKWPRSTQKNWVKILCNFFHCMWRFLISRAQIGIWDILSLEQNEIATSPSAKRAPFQPAEALIYSEGLIGVPCLHI